MKRNILFLLVMICLGCSQKPKQVTVKITLINNQHSLKIVGINYLILKEIAADTANNWQGLFPVYRMPVDTDMKDYQLAQPGKYLMKDSYLVFTPDTPFTCRNSYFIRYYQYSKDEDIWDLVKGKQRPGKVHFIDFIFKPE